MKNRQQLLNHINEVSFAVNDVHLYLDTHPCDKEALEYYHKVVEMRKHALEEYAKTYGPLLVDQVENCNYWQWVEEPWPWEGGYC
ncbi:MAG: spore coat protein CotJB [Lachnospiraceae bacterium]